MTKFIFLFVFYTSTLAGQILVLPASHFRSKTTTRFTFELANTPEQRTWGLMGRKELHPNHGMLFSYPSSNILSFWSFNCYIPLSVAFLDEEKIIRDLQDLEAYPEKMDKERPVYSFEDLSQYPSYDPILRFFQSKSIRSSLPAKYALEMNLHWFQSNDIKKGDVVSWKPYSTHGEIIHTLDLSALHPTDENMFLIKFAIPEPAALSIPKSTLPMEAVIFDSDDSILSKIEMSASASLPKLEKPVYYIEGLVKKIAILPLGWVEKNSIEALRLKIDKAVEKEIFP